MSRRPCARTGNKTSASVDRATFQAGDYGRVLHPDGNAQWWVRSSTGAWMQLSHQRVIENDDGTITLLCLM